MRARILGVLLAMVAVIAVPFALKPKDNLLANADDSLVIVSPHNTKEHAFAASLGARTLLTGWEEAYAASGRKAKPADDEEGTGSIEYARRHGALAVNIECGQHKDPNAPEVAYHAIRNALRHLGLTDEPPVTSAPIPTRLIALKQVYYRDDAGSFPKPWKHLEPVPAGAVLAMRASGATVTAPTDGFIIMPKIDCPIGEEWFYFGVEVAPTPTAP